MPSPLAAFGEVWQHFVDGLADMQTDLLRRMAADMADAVDDEARKTVEGEREWRDMTRRRGYVNDNEG